MPLATIGWPDVAIALVAGLPAIISAWAALHVKQQIKTPSGTAIGKQIESTHHVALGNNYRLRAVTGELGSSAPDAAVKQEAQVSELNGD